MKRFNAQFLAHTQRVCRVKRALCHLPLASALFLGAPATAFAIEGNQALLSTAVVASLTGWGVACHQDKAPCAWHNPLQGQRTLAFDIGQDATLQNRALWLSADWPEMIDQSGRWQLTGRWAINLQYWYSHESDIKNDQGWVAGVTPVFRVHWQGRNGLSPYVEAGVGPQVISDVWFENDNKSTQFQFSSLLGLGVRTQHYEFGYRFQHLSNNDIQTPNPDTDIHNLHFGVRF